MIKLHPLNEKGMVPVLLLVGVIGVIIALLFVSTAPFNDKLLSSLNSKPSFAKEKSATPGASISSPTPEPSATQSANIFYVSSTGNDRNSGTSPSLAWATLDKVSNYSFNAGSTILFEGGKTFSGNLKFYTDDKGTASNPITVSSYGTGQATIQGSSSSDGITIYNVAGLNLTNLKIVGPGALSSTKAAVNAYADLPNNTKLSHLYFDNVEVSNYYWGILIGGWNGTSGFDDVKITDAKAHDNGRGGIATYGKDKYTHSNIYVGRSQTYNNLGDPLLKGNNPSGAGIILGNVSQGIVENSVSYNNGINCKASACGVGIYTYDSEKITIQNNESYGNRTGSKVDGGGIDLDIAVTNSVMQYNYTHDNDGPGIYVWAASGPWNNNVIRYNISQNDSRKNNWGGMLLGGDFIDGLQVYHNTVYVSSNTSGSSPAVNVYSASKNVSIRNNIFVTTGGLKVVKVNNMGSNLVFQGNDYWSSGSKLVIYWLGTSYTSFANWRSATNQEKNSTANTGFTVDPGLQNPGGGTTIGFGNPLSSLQAYKLKADSPLLNKGLDLQSTSNTNIGNRDFYNQTNPTGVEDIGASEFN